MKGELLRRYNRFKKAVEFLKHISSMNPSTIIEDYVLLSSLERNIQVAVEFIVDLSNYILSEVTGETPDTYKSIVESVGKICNINRELVTEIKGVIGLRNIIVHLYADIDYDLVLKELGNMVNYMVNFVSKLIKCAEEHNLDP